MAVNIDNMALAVVSDDNTIDSLSLELKHEIEVLEASEQYKKVKELEKLLDHKKEQKEKMITYIIDSMVSNGIKEIVKNGFKIKVKNTARESVEVIDLKDVPKNFIRVKHEVDKKEILKQYRETGILTPGTDVVKKDNFKLEIKNM